ncbi:MAG: hypothetical protein R3D30_12355 [Hyphomicrobiales bacterium]
MSTRFATGPYRIIELDEGQRVPYYIIPFDKRGVCIGPKTCEHLVSSVGAGDYTDIFLFSHGWNNDWSAATKHYEHFLRGYMKMRASHDLPMPDSYKPLLVGIFWPSTALAFGESERGPSMAAANPETMDAVVGDRLDEIAAIAEEMAEDDAARLYELAQKDELGSEESLELARLLARIYDEPDDELGFDDAVSAEDLVAAWGEAQTEPDSLEDFGTANSSAGKGPQAASIGGLLRKLDPRPAIRLATVYKMKDRAGKVGARGVGPLLRDLLDGNDARLHLIGHSYGGKVVLSATAIAPVSRPVESILLLQPAVSHLCFADEVPGTDRAGGYRAVLERVKRPILSTFSRHDFPLTKVFHLALRRKKDLGEARIAAGEPPSKYAALGGFGPRRCGEKLIDMKSVNAAYNFDPNVEIYGLRGDAAIDGHGDVSNEATWWSLYSLVSS